MNRLAPHAVVLPVVAQTVRAPVVASGETVMFAVACVESVIDFELTVMPGPKSNVVALVKLVSEPITDTFSVAPCAALVGVTN